MSGGLVFECGESDELERVHGLSARIVLRDGLDGCRAVRSGHVRIEHAPGRLRHVPCRRVPGRIGLYGVQGLSGWLILPSWRVGATAVLCGHLLEHSEARECRRVHGVSRGLVVLDRFDVEHPLLAWNLHGHHGSIRMPRVHSGQLPGRKRLDRVQDLWRRQLLP